MKNLIIRKGKKEDIKQLWDLEIEMRLQDKKLNKKFLELGRYDVSDNRKRKFILNFGKWLKNKNSIFIVAEINKKIVGFVNGKIYKWAWSDDRSFNIGKFGDLVVLKKYQGHGIGKQLMDEFEKLLIKKNIKFVELNVMPKNFRAYKIYKKRGFSEYTLTMIKKLK